EYWDQNLTKQDGYTLKPMKGKVEGLVLVEGNQAVALGCLMGGCTVAAWYPITPSSSVCEYLGTYADRFRVDKQTGERKIAFVHTLSHGDTKHPILLPGTVEECYTFARDAFDYADRFQTAVFVLSDLDLGMNLWMTKPFQYPEKPFDHGKVLSAERIEELKG